MNESFSSFLEELAQNSIYTADLVNSQPSETTGGHQGPGGVLLQEGSQNQARSKRRENHNGQGSRRSKYIPRACQDCQRRKVKCSGDNVCTHCRNRKVECVYSSKPEGEPSRKRNRVSSPPQDVGQNSHDTHTASDSNAVENACQSVEDRIAKLQDRIKRNVVEKRDGGREMARMRFTSSNSYTFDASLISAEDTDTFDNGTGETNLSLSAQLSNLQKLLRHRAGVTTKGPENFHQSRVFPLELPPPHELRRLISVCFRELGSFFPFMDQRDTEQRAFRALDQLGYSEYCLIIDVDTQHHALMGLLCNILVLGETYDVESKSFGSTRPGWATYQRGKRLIQHCGSSRVCDIDLVRYHTMSCLYMMNSELLQPATHALSTSVQIAMMMKLNDQSYWQNHTDAERKSRQRLWWTIYFLDRRLSQRNGAPYIIRDHDVAVDHFQSTPCSKGKATSEPLSQHTATHDIQNHSAAEVTDSEKYLQSLIDFGQLWGYIWDNFYAALAAKGKDWAEVIMTDTRIYIFRTQLPAELTWDTEKVDTYLENGEDEPQIRRRLAIFIRTNLLRMIIRQNPTLSKGGDEEARLFCARLARSSVDAIEAFANACSSIHASGYFISTALVECIYHVMYILQDQVALQVVDRQALLGTFLKAYQLLMDFASTWPTARRAIQALSRAIFSGGDASVLFECLSKPQSENGDADQGLGSAKDGQAIKGLGGNPFSNIPDFDPAMFTSGTAPSLTDLSNEILNGANGAFDTGGDMRTTDLVDLDFAHLFATS